MIEARRIAPSRPRPSRRPSLRHERELAAQAGARVAGLDEVGRGAWAGPVVAAAVVLDLARARGLGQVRDSKQLTARRRAALFPLVRDACAAFGIGLAGADEIDALGIVPATRLAMSRALAALTPAPDALIIDALRLPEVALPQRAFHFADSTSLSVAAASIVAKVTRDRMMIELAARYPGYGFDRHKGYGTRLHRQALHALGLCDIHRRTFRPMALLSA